MPTHVQKSTWAMADHDSYVLLFLTAAFMFYLRAVKAGGDERLSRHTNASPSGIIKAMAEVLKHRRKASANAIAAGVCFSIVALRMERIRLRSSNHFPCILRTSCNEHVQKKRQHNLICNQHHDVGYNLHHDYSILRTPTVDLVLNSTGLTPLLFITLFTVAIAWITTGFRDKPWLLVLGSYSLAVLRLE